MMRKPRCDASAPIQRAHIRVIFERHESLPMASGSVALSGAMGGLDPKVGSIVLMGGAIEQAKLVGMQPDATDVAKQLHVKPPIVIESTSPAANTRHAGAGPSEKRTRRGGRLPLLYEGVAVARVVGAAVTAQEEQIGA